jgi:hypothetical protein
MTSRTTPKRKKAPLKPKSKVATKVHLKCVECDQHIHDRDQALFVEEDVGRYFCSEPCIVAHFTPEIEKLEREYGRGVSANDLTSEERERYAHLRWMNLEQPDEVWCEKTVKGDHRYTLIAEYRPDQKNVWAVAICLMLRGEPSFLYLAFVTSDRYLVDIFRRGDKQVVARKTSLSDQPEVAARSAGTASAPAGTSESDRLGEPWTEADSLRVNILKKRRKDDILVEDFGFYQNCLEETLQEPSELWSYLPTKAPRVYHFIRKYDHDESFWYVVMAKDARDASQIEIVDAFPTHDLDLVQLCRYGEQEKLDGSKEANLDEVLPESIRRNVH